MTIQNMIRLLMIFDARDDLDKSITQLSGHTGRGDYSEQTIVDRISEVDFIIEDYHRTIIEEIDLDKQLSFLGIEDRSISYELRARYLLGEGEFSDFNLDSTKGISDTLNKMTLPVESLSKEAVTLSDGTKVRWDESKKAIRIDLGFNTYDDIKDRIDSDIVENIEIDPDEPVRCLCRDFMSFNRIIAILIDRLL